MVKSKLTHSNRITGTAESSRKAGPHNLAQQRPQLPDRGQQGADGLHLHGPRRCFPGHTQQNYPWLKVSGKRFFCAEKVVISH